MDPGDRLQDYVDRSYARLDRAHELARASLLALAKARERLNRADAGRRPRPIGRFLEVVRSDEPG